ncbi:MAG: hypothetical protein SFW67_19280 [Myxococcaceae bacterium]|nr:hypothetical protein [Myxococcaceae bacterium]
MLSSVVWLVLVQTSAQPCDPGERVVMTCAVKTKRLSVCAGPPEGPVRWLQYRFGPVGAPELTWPPTREGSASAFTFKTTSLIDGTATTLAFTRAGVRYEVWTQDGRSAGGGVVVHPPKGRPVTLACTSAPVAAWDEVRSVLGTGAAGPIDCQRAADAYADRALRESKGQMDGVQQAALTDAVKALCERDWSPEARGCIASGAPARPALSPAQQRALTGAARAVVSPEGE